MANDKTERSEINRMGGRPQKNSGRSKYQKGDAVLPPFIVDVKESLKSFTLNTSVWAKICTDAARHRLDPALMICLGEGRDTTRLWVVSDTMFHIMLDAYRKVIEEDE